MPRKRRLVVIKWTAINHIQRYPDVAEIALLPVQEAGDGFECEPARTVLVCPRGFVSEEFTRATGLYSGTLEAQPALEELMPTVIEALGNDVLVFETPVERAAFEKMCVPHKPDNLMLDLVTLGHQLFPQTDPGLEPHGLEAMTEMLSVEPALNRRAGEIAGQMSRVLVASLERVAKKGRWDTIKDALKKKLPKRITRRGKRPATLFDIEKLKAISGNPGVYFMKNEAGEILYIGKAKNLRNRLRSYFQSPKGLPSKVLELLRQVSRIDTQEVGSELEALLLEARLIKQHQPFFNKMIKNFQRLAFLKITAYEGYPKVMPSSEMDDPKALYFGPFPSIGMIQNRMDIMNRVFELRGCTDRQFAEHKEYPCMDYDMGLCSGPCAGKISSEDYTRRVHDFVEYLSERPSNRLQELTARRDLLAEDLQFEKAAAIQQRMDILETLQWGSARFVEAVERHNCIIVLPGATPGSLRRSAGTIFNRQLAAGRTIWKP